MFKIGDFSQLTQVTVKALRYYDRLGLLPPAQIDPESGYRYYRAAQLPRLNQILALKDLGFSLEQIGHLLDADLSTEQLRTMLVQKRQEVQDTIVAEHARLERIEERLGRLAAGAPGMDAVTVKRIPAQRVASLRGSLANYPGVGALFGELRAWQEQYHLRATAWTAVWHDGEYRETDIHAEATFATADALPPDPRIHQGELAAVETMACILHHGSMQTVGAAHHAMLGWMEANGYRLAGANRTRSLRIAGPRSPDSIIEIQYPVTRAQDAD